MPLSSDVNLLALLRSTHTATVRAELTDSAGNVYELDVVDGSVSIDARRSVRRSLTLEVLDVNGTLTSNNYASPLTPFGATITVWRGALDPITLTTPAEYEVQLGVFTVTSVTVGLDSDGAIIASVTADDNVYTISRTKFRQSVEVTAGTRFSDPSDASPGALQVVLNALTGARRITRNLPTIAETVNYKWPGSDPEENPWNALSEIAQGAGYEIYFTNTGALTATVVPSISGTADWEYLDDGSNVILSVSRTFDGEGVMNGVGVSGVDSREGAFTVYRFQELGFTGSKGVLGERSWKVENTYVKNVGQGETAADRLLNVVIGQPIQWEQVPNPAMDVRDRVRIRDTRLNVDVTALVDVITIPLNGTGSMSVQARYL